MAEPRLQQRDACVPFWGILFLFLGVVFLLQTLNILPWGLWRTLGRLWPVLIIALGICLVMRRFNAWLVSLIIAALFAGALGIAYWQYQPVPTEPPGTMSFSQPMDNLKKAQVDINFEAGNLSIANLAASARNVVESNTQVDFRRQDSEASISLKRNGMGWPFWDKGRDNWQVDFAQGVPLSIDAELNMANANFDLRQLQVSEIRIDADLTNCNVRMPAAGTTSAYIKADLSTVEISVPEEVAARIRVRADLTPVTVNEKRFPRQGDYYLSSDYDAAKNRVELEIDADLSTVTIK